MTTTDLERRRFRSQRISFLFHFLMAHRYYHRFPREAPSGLFREAAMSVMSLRDLMNHIVYSQLLHVSIWLISLDHCRRWYPWDRVLALGVIVIIIIVVIVVVIVVLVAGIVVAGIGCSQLLHFHSRHRRCRRRRRHGRRHRVLRAAFSRAFRHPAVSHGCKETSRMWSLGKSRGIR